MVDQPGEPPDDGWTPQEKWQFIVALLTLLVAIIACVEQFVR